jgi:elongation factor 1-beta
MGIAAIKIKIMPKSPKVNLDEIEKKAIEIIKGDGSESVRSEREEIAFGLTAIIILFSWDEQKDTEELLNKIRKIPKTNSVEVIDFRRAFG